MLYRRDPIFQNIGPNDFFNVLFKQAPKIDSRIVSQWADGIFLEQLDKFKKNQQLLITNCMIVVPEYSKNVYTVNPSYYGIYYQPYDQLKESTVIKQFACFMNRFDIFRQSWFYHFIRRGWLDQAWISFNCDAGPNRVPDPSYRGLSQKEIFAKAFRENNAIFADEHERIKDQIPYKNFDDTGDLTPWIMSSRFNIVLEVWFHGNHCITFTEKTMRSLQLPRPWLLYASAGSVQQLRRWGFDVLDDIVDHGYDLIADNIQRQITILNTAADIMNFDIQICSARLHKASVHNRAILEKWHRQWFINMERDFEVAGDKLRCL